MKRLSSIVTRGHRGERIELSIALSVKEIRGRFDFGSEIMKPNSLADEGE